MPFTDLRSFISFLESKSELAKVTRQLDNKTFEISAILDRLPKVNGKAVVFEKLKDSKIPLVANILGTTKRILLSLETNEPDLHVEWDKRFNSEWVKPKEVSDGICQEKIIKKENVDLQKYPVFKWNPLDAAPYLTLGVLISNDPETDERNAGIYRLMVQGRNQLGINLQEGRGAMLHYRKAELKNQPLEVAIAIGLEPTVLLAAATNLKQGEDELAFAGALRKEALRITKCKTVDVDVPSTSEIVIEGVIPPKIRVLEGPFGESTGFYGKAKLQPIIRVSGISERENPLYQCTYTGKFPKEEHFISSASGYNHDLFTKRLFLSTKETSRVLKSISGRLKLELGSKPIRLPSDTVDLTSKNWTSYGLI